MNEIFETTIDCLIHDKRCDAILFGPLLSKRENTHAIRKIGENLSDTIHIARESRQGPETVIALPESFDDYLKSLSRKERGNFRRTYKQLCNTFTVNIEFVDDTERAIQEFNRFVIMHGKQWQQVRKPGHFGAWPNSKEFHSDLLQSQSKLGRLRLLHLKADNKVIAYRYMYAFGDCYYSYLTARITDPKWNKFGLGRLIYVKTAEYAIKEGIRRINIGREHYEYKVRLGGEEHSVTSILLAANRYGVRIRCRLYCFMVDLLNLIYYKIWIARLFPRLGQRKSPFWKTWIRSNV